MNLKIHALISALVLGSTCLSVSATGNIGDPAPALSVAAWAKGSPVDLAAGRGKNIYVIEFWATWCGPCKASIPHLTEVQRRFKDKGVVVIGISSEPKHTVAAFVNQMGNTMNYTVAADQNENTNRAYLDAFGVEGIPHAFIIDRQGRIAWQGDPRDEMESVLERMVASKFDTDHATETARAGKLSNDYFSIVQKLQQSQDQNEKHQLAVKARHTGDDLIKNTTRNSEALYQFCWNIVLGPTGDYRDLELAARVAEAAFNASKRTPTDKARKLMHDYLRTAQTVSPTGSPDTRRLDDLSQGVLKDGDPRLLKDFAWALLIGSTLKHRDLNLAVRMAQAACIATHEQDASILDTYSLALFVTGKREQAIAAIAKAIAVNKDESLRERLEKMMEQYRNASSGGVTFTPTSR